MISRTKTTKKQNKENAKQMFRASLVRFDPPPNRRRRRTSLLLTKGLRLPSAAAVGVTNQSGSRRHEKTLRRLARLSALAGGDGAGGHSVSWQRRRPDAPSHTARRQTGGQAGGGGGGRREGEEERRRKGRMSQGKRRRRMSRKRGSKQKRRRME